MDPVLQTFQQQNSGSAEGQGFGNFYVQGRQLNQGQQHLNIAKKAETRAQREQDIQFNLSQQHLDLQKKADARAQAQQEALLPLQRQLLEFKSIQDGVALGTVATQAQAGIASNVIIPQVNELAGQFADAPDGYANDALRKKAAQLMTRNPWAFSVGLGAEIKQGMQAFTMQRTKDVMELAHDATIQDAAEAAKNGYNMQLPGDAAGWRKEKAFNKAEAIAEKRGQQFDPSKLVPGWYDPDTGHVDPEKLAISIQQMPRSAFLQSREDIAQLREEFRTLVGRDYAPGPLEKDIKFIDAREAAGLLPHDKAERARDVRQGLEAKSSAAGDWMQRTEVQGLVKQKSKLMDAKIVAENDLEDELAKGKKTFGGTSASKAANLKRKVDQWNKKIENVNKEIDTFKPDGSGNHTRSPVLAPDQTGSLMDTNIIRLAPQPTLPRVRRYNPATGLLE